MDDGTAQDMGEVSRGDRPIAPDDLPGRPRGRDTELAAGLQAQIAELDAVGPEPTAERGRFIAGHGADPSGGHSTGW